MAPVKEALAHLSINAGKGLFADAAATASPFDCTFLRHFLARFIVRLG
jgi:hypothetical protein